MDDNAVQKKDTEVQCASCLDIFDCETVDKWITYINHSRAKSYQIHSAYFFCSDNCLINYLNYGLPDAEGEE